MKTPTTKKSSFNRIPQKNLSIRDWKEINRIMNELKLEDTASLVTLIEGQRQQRNIFFD